MVEQNQIITIVVELHCSEVTEPVEKQLLFPSLPTNFRNIKERVEECCSVPMCVQTLQYQSVEVSDDCSLSSMYMRSGDTVKVFFPQYGKCEDVREAVKWLRNVSLIFEEFERTSNESELRLLYDKYYDTIHSENIDILVCDLFCPWGKKERVNCSQFMALGGTKLLVELHKKVIGLRNEKSDVLSYLSQYFEKICCRTVTNFVMDFDCRRHMLEIGGLDQCIHSFLIKPANDKSLYSHNSYNIVASSAYALCNIAELPEIQVLLSAKPEIVEQINLIGKCSMYTCQTVEITVGILICMTQSPEAHLNLMKPDLFEELIKVCAVRSERQQANDVMKSLEVKALEYYIALIMSHMVCGSPHLLHKFPKQCLENSIAHIDMVLLYPSELLRKHEMESQIVWITFEPVLSFLYSPYSPYDHKDPSNQGKLINQFHNRATRVLLHFLETSLGRKDHIDSFMKEKLLDFIVALTWSVPYECQEQARNICKQVEKFAQIQPPTLMSLTVAKLAKMKWGFKKLREMASMPQLLLSIP